MQRRQLVIPPRFLLLALMVCAAYWIVTATTGFSPLAAESTFSERVGECAAIWSILCTAYVGICLLRQRPYPQGHSFWPVAVVPFLAGIWVAAAGLQWAKMADPVEGLLMVLPVVMGAIGSAWLRTLFWLWNKEPPRGLCHECRYDLRGTVSNRCPECGIQIAADGSTRPPISPRWMPELLLFDTAEQRDAGWKSCQRVLGRRPAYWLAWSPWFCAIAICFAQGYLIKRLGTAGWGLLGAGCLIAIGSQWLTHRMTRRALRQIILESGIPVCLHCGQDLREAKEDACPNCKRKPSSGP